MMEQARLLLDELSGYEPADDVERGHLSEIRTLLEAADPFSRGGFAPGHITASCFILDPSGRVLLHHHRRLGRWLQMGGHVEPGESAAQAALREGMEESGLRDLQLASSGILDLDVHDIPAARGELDHRHFDVRYLARTNEPDGIMMDEQESTKLAWVQLAEAASMMGTAESGRVIAKIEKALCRS